MAGGWRTFLETVRRLFGGGTPSRRAEADEARLRELVTLLRAAARPVTVLRWQASSADQVPITGTHFGGPPYAEAGESWPVCRGCRRPLDFLAQFNLMEEFHERAPEVDLLTLFFCQECFPSGGDERDAGKWVVRAYQDPSSEKAVPLRPGPDPGESGHVCVARAEAGQSFPWIEDATPEMRALLEGLARDVALDLFDEALRELVPHEQQDTRIGGYPDWIQDPDPRSCPQCNEEMRLLVQMGDVEPAGFMWGDAGLAYLFHCPRHPREIAFLWQCH